MKPLKVFAIGAEATVISTLAVSSYHVAFAGASGADWLAGVPIITVAALECLRLPISFNLPRMKLLGGAMSVALLAGLSVVTFEAANVGFENLIFQRTRPVAEAERDLVKAQNAQNTLKNEIARHDGVIAGLTADVETARKHQEEINKQTAVLQPYPAQQPVPTYAAPTPQPVPATQMCVGKKGIRFICNKPAQDNVIKNNAQAEAEAQKTFREDVESMRMQRVHVVI